MTSGRKPEQDDALSLIQAISLELALAEPGANAGVAQTSALISRLMTALASRGQHGFEDVIARVAPVIRELEAVSATWQQRQIDILTDGLITAQLLLDNLSYTQAAAPAAGDTIRAPEDETDAEEPLAIDSRADRDFLLEFCSEGRDLLQDIERGVLVLEQTPTHQETLNSIFRAFHTFKGGAGFLGLKPVKDVAHELESLLDAIRQGKIPADRDSINLILAGRDCLAAFVDAIGKEVEAPTGRTILIPTAVLKDQIIARLSGEHVAGLAERSKAAPELRISDPIPEPPSATTRAPTQESPRAPQKPEQPIPGATPHTPPARGSDNPDASASVRIGLEKLDALVDLVAELVIAQSMVIESPVMETEDNAALSRDILVLRRITKELQHNAMSLRMVPVKGAFQKMQRLVRDLAGEQEKIIHLQTSGEETEIDRNIVAQLTDPLIHMVRNACDHGIETAEQRIAAGKPSHGTISLSAFHQGGGIIIRIADDGRGLDPDKIRRRAVERGIIPADAELAREDILQLIFMPGFSTAETITDLSGRGVGMDVVKGNISKLRGRIEIDSTVGTGTIFTIYLPLTLAIIQGMVVGVGEERFIIPTLTMRESFKPEPDMVTPVLGRGSVINRRGRLLPVLDVAKYLGIRPRHSDPTTGIAIIAESGTSQCCLLVDRLIGSSEVVIKDLGDAFENQAAMSGAAILGDGRVALIIDVDHMVSAAASSTKRQSPPQAREKAASAQPS